MTSTENEQISVGELLKDAPRNWGKWGPDDEVGSLNYLTPDVVVKAAGAIKSGKVFTLQVKMANPEGDPVWPGRSGAVRTMVIDEGHYIAGKGVHFAGRRPLRRRLHDVLPAGLDAVRRPRPRLVRRPDLERLRRQDHDRRSRQGQRARRSPRRASSAAGILLDIARWRGKDVLDVAETFTHEDLMACAKAQGAEIQRNDILIIRTGWIAKFYKVTREEFYGNFVEPGLTYSPELVQWFHDMEIPNLVTDTIANEVTVDPVSGVVLPLHNALDAQPRRHADRDRLARRPRRRLRGRRPVHVPLHGRPAEGRQRHRRRRSTPSSSSRRRWRTQTGCGWRSTAPARHPTSHSAARAASPRPLEMFAATAAAHADKPLIHYAGTTLTVAEVDRMSSAARRRTASPTASPRATASPCTCRTCRSSRSPCWRRGRRAASSSRSTR